MSVVACIIVSMKKKVKPLNKRAEARRKAESRELFLAMMKQGKHTIVVPANRKGTRTENKRNAIKESM
jgi:hypothetical protein